MCGVLALSGCAWMPDYVNPVEWYNSVFDEPEPESADQERLVVQAEGPVPGAKDPFPSLVAPRGASPSEQTAAELRAVGEGLMADRDAARYTDEVIRRQGERETQPPPILRTVQPPPALRPAQPRMAAAPAPPPRAAAPAAPVALTAAPAAPRGRVDVKKIFGELFSASGIRAVAPPRARTQLALAAAPAGLAVSAAPAAAGTRPVVLFFGAGSAKISAKGHRDLREAARVHRERGGTVRVVGHASSRTREMPVSRHQLVNFDVSVERARSVADELLRLGVPPDALQIAAKSDNEPVYSEWMPSGEAANRRVEVYFDF